MTDSSAAFKKWMPTQFGNITQDNYEAFKAGYEHGCLDERKETLHALGKSDAALGWGGNKQQPTIESGGDK